MPEDTHEVSHEDVYATGVEGRSYYGSSYMPTAYDNLDVAPETDAHPDRGTGESGHRLLDLPQVPKLAHVVGPSAILLGASLGSGETLFWPLLVATHGWGIYWLFILGVFTQFFVNTEIQRWTVATGESIFRGFERVSRFWPLAFLVMGFVSLGWPGWAASAAKVGTIGLGVETDAVGVPGLSMAAWKLAGIGLLVLIWLSYQLTPVMYNVVERLQILLVTTSVLAAVVLFLALGSFGELANAPRALVDRGAIPPGGDVALLLGGIAFAGAGGYLNLSQSLWVREKGYGMGRYQGRIKNPVVGDDSEPVHRDGFSFPPSVANMRRWRGWWRLVQLEHLLTFVVGLLVVATMLISVAAEFAPVRTDDALVMWTETVIPQVGAVSGGIIYVTLFVALFTTEYGIVESFVRNSADVIYELYGRDAGWSLPRIFWGLLTVFTLWGVAILALPLPFSLERPFGLLVAGAALSGLMMWPYTAVLTVTNTTRLPEHTQPGWIRLVALWWATAFLGYFSAILLTNWLQALFGSMFAIEWGVVGSAPGGYLVFGVVAAVELVVVAVSARGKYRARDTVQNAEEAWGLLH